MNTGAIFAAVVLADDGSVDGDATLANAEAAVAESREEHSALTKAIDAQFKSQLNDKGEEVVQPKDYFINGVLAKMNVGPDAYSKKSALVTEFIDENSDSDSPDRLFTITRGKGGGIRRGAVAAK